jgi:hypothetical protein
MAKYNFLYVPDVEEIIVRDLREYLHVDARINEIYPKFSGVNVTQEHPFAQLTAQEIAGQIIPVEVFPCIVVMDLNASRDPGAVYGAAPADATIGATAVAEIAANRDDWVISDDTLAVLQAATATPGSTIQVQRSGVQHSASLAFEIWADSAKVKNVLYYTVFAYLLSTRRAALRQRNVGIREEQVSGEKTGVYNFDFGMMLHGGMIRVPCAYVIESNVYDTELGTVTGVSHIVDDIHSADS